MIPVLKALLLLFIIGGTFVNAQIPGNDDNLPCVNQVFLEDFSSEVPLGWEGDFMLLEPPLAEGWILQSGPTPTTNTGPDVAFSGDYYLYLETSGPAGTGEKYTVSTSSIDLTAIQEVSPTVRFRVLMYGENMGSLFLNVLSGPGFTNRENVLTISGQQHNSGDVSNWEEAFVNIGQYEGEVIRLEFVGMKGNGSRGDIAIDLLQVCTDPRIPTLGEWGMIILSLSFLIIGVVFIRQRRGSMIGA